MYFNSTLCFELTLFKHNTYAQIEVKMNLKNFKIVRSLNNISKLKWAMFSKLQDCKIASKYIDYLIPEDKKDINKDNEKLEQMVRETLIREFGPKAREMKSFDLIVDATVHRLKLKQLQADGDYEEIEL